MLTNPLSHFARLPDPRRQTRNKLHKLEDIVTITLCEVLCGFEDWVSIEDFGHENERWLRKFLELPNGIPSHDTLSKVMGRIESVEKDHGRLETRRVVVSTDLDWLPARGQWAGLQAVAMVEATREKRTGQSSRERRYYLCSITDPQRIAQAIRAHWSIENQQHWVLDVQFGEDAHRARKDHSAANLGIVRRAALNLLRDNDDSSLSIRRRKMRACTNLAYRQRILFGDLSSS